MSERELFVPLSTGPFRRFEAGTKTVEVRNKPARWRRGATKGRRVRLRRGYSTPDELHGTVGRVVEASSVQDLPYWALEGIDMPDMGPFVDIHQDVIAFEVILDA